MFMGQQRDLFRVIGSHAAINQPMFRQCRIPSSRRANRNVTKIHEVRLQI